MRFQFKNQSFQTDAAAVCDLFIGQPLQSENIGTVSQKKLPPKSAASIVISCQIFVDNAIIYSYIIKYTKKRKMNADFSKPKEDSV